MFDSIMMTFKLRWRNVNYDTCTHAVFHKAL